MFYDSIKQGSHKGLGIEAAVMGAEKNHPWIKHLLDYYENKEFKDKPEYYNRLIMSGIIAELSAEKFGFRYYPIYQVLKNDVHLYPPDVFSRIGSENVVKYFCHLCASSWRDAKMGESFLKRAFKAITRRRIKGPFGNACPPD